MPSTSTANKMVVTKLLGEDRATSIFSLGSSLKRKERLLWEGIERENWGSDPNYVPSLTIRRKDEEKEFFILRRGEKAIGRAAATVGRQWTSKDEGAGFIDDFVINPEDKDCAPTLIKRCLCTLKEKGVSEVIVRSYHFPGLAERNEGLPPFGLPYTPQWYIDLFEKFGFVKYKEWRSFRMKSVPPISPEEIKRGDEFLQSLRLKFKPLNVLSRREVEGYNKLLVGTLEDHFGYYPQAIKISFLGRASTWFIFKLMRVRVYVLQSRSGKIMAYYSFQPYYNVVLKRMGGAGGLNLLNPRFLLSLGRVKRAVLGAHGHAETVRGNGMWKAMQSFRLKKLGEEGYTEVDSGRMLSENIPVVRAVEATYAKYGGKFTKYYTLGWSGNILDSDGRVEGEIKG